MGDLLLGGKKGIITRRVLMTAIDVTPELYH